MDKLREEFEQWWNNKMAMCFYSQPKSQKETIYHASWLTWQASRASIVVESITPSDAPSGLIYQIGGAGLSHDEAICEGYSAGFNEAIRSIGLSIKGDRV
ncbi:MULTISPECIES: hypothetical protein [Serratia]|uniref:hypothetical protein n=1 Tax=Serratia TaxID=613 RepID=UPI0012B530D7|nr:hypothetical protein [Serratia marcescens]